MATRWGTSTLLAVASTLGSTAVAFLVQPYAQRSDLAMIQLLGIVLTSVRFSFQDSITATVVGILAFDFLFIEPRFQFAWTDAKSGFTFIAMLVVSGVISRLTKRMRDQELLAAMERQEIAQAVRRTELEAEVERQRNSLLSAISHDLKTPLASMIAAASTLIERRRELGTEESTALLSTIVGEGERLEKLIENLLSISRLESPTIELRRTPEAVEEIVAVAVRRVSPRFTRKVRTDVQGTLPLVFVEPLLIEQVLVNLLENAARYAGTDATVSVSAAMEEAFVAIRVADDGPGIPENETEKVFEKFYRGRLAGRNDGGAGLGLTICRAIVRAHGGAITLGRRDTGGTVVEFTIPLAQRSSRPPPPEPNGKAALS